MNDGRSMEDRRWMNGWLGGWRINEHIQRYTNEILASFVLCHILLLTFSVPLKCMEHSRSSKECPVNACVVTATITHAGGKDLPPGRLYNMYPKS